MLNELADIAASLSRCGIQLPASHPSVKQPARAEALCVRLADGARIQGVEHLPADRMTQLWTLREGMHNSFPRVVVQHPVTNVPRNSPLRRALEAAAPDNVRERAELLQRCLVDGATIPVYFDDLWLRLRKRATGLLETSWESLELKAWRVLLDIVARAETSGREWFKELALESIAGCLTGRLPCIALVEALVAGTAGPDDDAFRASVPLFFDVADPHHYSLPVAHPDVAHHVAAALTLTAAAISSEALGTCALSGQQVALETSMFPAPNLPGMGVTYLLSMNPDVPCQTRYGLTGTSILPVGRELVANIENALKWIVGAPREGRTWRRVPGVKPGERDLLVAYLEQLPDFEAELASVFAFGGDDVLDAAGQAAFDAVCGGVLASLRAQRTVTPADAVRLLVLRKVDKGRAQIVLSRRLTVEALIDAAAEWRDHCGRNMPMSGTYLLGKKGEKAKWVAPPLLFPDQPVGLLGRQWQRAGTESQEARRCSLQEAFDLFLPPAAGCQAAARRLLGTQLERASPLLGALGHGNSRWKDRRWKHLKPFARVEGLKHISLMGTLLYRLERKKEVYMNEAAFKLGELLALADGLHGEYCRVRRKGGYPPQLIGNALLAAAAHTPARALARLGERLRVYQAWAATSQGGEVALAKWCLGRFGEISRTLHDLGIPEGLDDPGRAELLLGYLARQGKTRKQEASSDAQERSGGDDHV